MPTEIGIVDLMIGFPSPKAREHYHFMRPLFHDEESRNMEFPAQYMFKEVPHLPEDVDHIAATLELMDRYGRVTPTGIRIDERFTHMQLAEMIGTSRETLTKVLNELRDAHLIDVRERLVWVIDVDGLDRVKRSA